MNLIDISVIFTVPLVVMLTAIETYLQISHPEKSCIFGSVKGIPNRES